MGTRSLIGIKSPRGIIEFIYCHWDGYPSHNGKILIENYNQTKKVYNLIGLGDISSLGEEIGEKQDFDSPSNKSWCVSYIRDRGESEDVCGYQTVHSEDEFLRQDFGSEYKYLFKDNKWYFSNGRHGFAELTPEVCK